ncbi:hypothetical protein LTS08_005932 [Lithohypha guttulata]|uniref:uncharacterized protein n=1 Tax=Lithohypha guttulata TaxID=1690604 RepID=UPI002DDF545C|nr:hypothetical protein LTR51_002446 [Lithohypha guttulata]KAK5099350.1 hypothetical protein LTS08_005932 [Lithohypha guttulata]
MHSARVGETICSSTRAVRDASFCIDKWHELPVSRLLQIERYRGFEYPHNRDHGGCSFQLRARAQLNVSSDTLYVSSFRRSFTVHASQQASQSRPIRPGPPSLGIRRPRPTAQQDEDSGFTILSYSEDRNRRIVEERQAREAEIKGQELSRAISLLQVQLDTWSSGRLDRSVIAQALAEQRRKGQKQYDEKFELCRSIWILAVNHLKDLEAHMQYSQAWILYCKHRFALLDRSYSTFTTTLSQLNLQVNRLRYAVEWWRWKVDELDVRAQITADFVTQLKAIEIPQAPLAHSPQASLTYSLHDILDTNVHISNLLEDGLLLRLEEAYYNTRDPPPVSKAAVSLRENRRNFLPDISAIGMKGHVFRWCNRLSQTDMRLPGSVDPELVVLSVSLASYGWLHAYDQMQFEIQTCLGLLKKNPARYKKWEVAQRSFRGRDLFFGLQEELQVFLAKGTVLCRGEIMSRNQLDWCTYLPKYYACFRPFEEYATIMSQTVQALRSWKKPGREECSRYDSAIAKLRLHQRDFLSALDRLTVSMNTRLQVRDDVYIPKTWLRKRNFEASLQIAQSRAISSLTSRSDLYRDVHLSSNAIIDPLKLLEDCSLYPRTKTIEAEYVFSEQRALTLLADLARTKVIGVEIVAVPHWTYKSSSLKATVDRTFMHWLFATPDRVFIVEKFVLGPSRVPFLALKSLMETRDILKIFHGWKTWESLLPRNNIFAQGIVDVEPSSAVKDAYFEKPDRRGWCLLTDKTFLREAEKEGIRAAICNLALQPTYNLITFFNAVASRPELLAQLSSEDRSSILATCDTMKHNLGRSSEPPTFGPLRWDSDASVESEEYLASFTRNVHGSGKLRKVTLLDFVQGMVIYETRRRSISSKTQAHLVAYYLFTSFGQQLPVVSNLTGIVDVAEKILEVVSKLSLRLNAEHRTELERITGPCLLTSHRVSGDESNSTKPRRRRTVEKEILEEAITSLTQTTRPDTCLPVRPPLLSFIEQQSTGQPSHSETNWHGLPSVSVEPPATSNAAYTPFEVQAPSRSLKRKTGTSAAKIKGRIQGPGVESSTPRRKQAVSTSIKSGKQVSRRVRKVDGIFSAENARLLNLRLREQPRRLTMEDMAPPDSKPAPTTGSRMRDFVSSFFVSKKPEKDD